MTQRRVQFVDFDGRVFGADTKAWTLRGIVKALDIPDFPSDYYLNSRGEIWSHTPQELLGNLFDPDAK